MLLHQGNILEIKEFSTATYTYILKEIINKKEIVIVEIYKSKYLYKVDTHYRLPLKDIMVLPNNKTYIINEINNLSINIQEVTK